MPETPIGLPALLELRAGEDPDQTAVEEVGGQSGTWRDIFARSLAWAACLKAAGVQRGDRVVTMLPPRIESLCAWAGIAWLKAIDVGANVDYRGSVLAHVLRISRPRVVIAAQQCLPALGELNAELNKVERVIVAHETGDPVDIGVPSTSVSQVRAGAYVEPCAPGPWETACMIFTSGTTGPPKGVLIPWAQVHAASRGLFPLDEVSSDDALYSSLSANTLGSRLNAYLMATVGGRLVTRDRPSVRKFWADVRQHRCTMTQVLFERMLHREPSRPDDSDNPLRLALMAPLTPDYKRFENRFGVRACTCYGMTEIGVVLQSGGSIENADTCGRVRTGPPGYDVRVVDENDYDVGPGRVGELVVRTLEPWTLNAGYFEMPTETAKAWRNGWFHTGDAFRYDETGNFYFVDRLRDCIKRRGETISSFEVEALMLEHTEITECAAVAVPAEGGDEELKTFVVRRSGSSVDAEEVIRFLIPRLPPFMLPRYVEFIEELPKTATMRVKKRELRDRGIGNAAWDREAAGIRIDRLQIQHRRSPEAG